MVKTDCLPVLGLQAQQLRHCQTSFPDQDPSLQVDLAQVDPVQVDLAQVDLAQVDPAQVDPAQVDPAQADLVQVRMRATAIVFATLDHQAWVDWSDPFPFQLLVYWAEGV